VQINLRKLVRIGLFVLLGLLGLVSLVIQPWTGVVLVLVAGTGVAYTLLQWETWLPAGSSCARITTARRVRPRPGHARRKGLASHEHPNPAPGHGGSSRQRAGAHPAGSHCGDSFRVGGELHAVSRPGLADRAGDRILAAVQARHAASEGNPPVSGYWTRAEKISATSAAIAVIALGIAATPSVSDVVKHFTGPRATIAMPAEGSTQPGNLGATGTATNIPRDDDLWLVIRSGIEGRWYPVSRIVPQANGVWTIPRDVIQPAKGFQEIEVIMLSDSDEAQFIDYVNQRISTGADPGLSSIPSVYSLEAVVRITVR
jgi:hypothetical protein